MGRDGGEGGGRRRNRGGGGGMKQIGMLDSDRDDYQYRSSSAGGGGGAGRSKAGLCGKGGERPTFTRHVPKFLQRFEAQIKRPDFHRNARIAQSQWMDQQAGGKGGSSRPTPLMGDDLDESDALEAATIVPPEEAVLSTERQHRGKQKFDDFLKRGNVKQRRAEESDSRDGAADSSVKRDREDERGPASTTSSVSQRAKKPRRKGPKLKRLDNASLLSFGDDDPEDA